jgi:hypothetical protein
MAYETQMLKETQVKGFCSCLTFRTWDSVQGGKRSTWGFPNRGDAMAPSEGIDREKMMPNSVRHGAALSAAVAGLIMLAIPTERALGDKPASPVTVVNPATSPVPTSVVNPASMPALTSSVDDPGRIPYQSQISNSCINVQQCALVFSAVPPNHRLVIQHVSGDISYSANPGAVLGFIFTSGVTVNNPTIHFVPITVSFGAGTSAIFDQPVQYYVDAGMAPEVTVSHSGGGNDATGSATLVGYMLDCSAAPCAAIAQ